MEVVVRPNGVLEINDARLKYCNFEGREEDYNREGERNFHVVFDDEEMVDCLIADGWNIRKKINKYDELEMTMKVKVGFNDYGPTVVLVSGNRSLLLNETNVHRLDKISRGRVDLDIRPHDWTMQNGKSGRTAWLNGIKVVQNIDRFAAELAEEEYPGEAPWN